MFSDSTANKFVYHPGYFGKTMTPGKRFFPPRIFLPDRRRSPAKIFSLPPRIFLPDRRRPPASSVWDVDDGAHVFVSRAGIRLTLLARAGYISAWPLPWPVQGLDLLGGSCV